MREGLKLHWVGCSSTGSWELCLPGQSPSIPAQRASSPTGEAGAARPSRLERQTDTGQRRRPASPSASGTALRPRRSGAQAEAEWRRRRSLGLRDAPTVPVPECPTCSSAAVVRWRRGRALRCAPARAAAMETGLCVAEEGPERAGAAGPAPARGEGGRGGQGRARGRDETMG